MDVFFEGAFLVCLIGVKAFSGKVSGKWILVIVTAALRLSWLLIIYGARADLLRKSSSRRLQIQARVRAEQEAFEAQERLSRKSEDAEWEKVERFAAESAQKGRPAKEIGNWAGIVGFLHPFCNAGGGGERVLWAAIKATQERWPKATCVVYTGDQDASKSTILDRVKSRFDIHLHPPTIVFLYLEKRDKVLSSTWPRFTLLGQSYGSLIMAYDALGLLIPDVLVDTMGYAFALSLCRWLFPNVATGAYVHYPFIGTHMVESLTSDTGQGVNAGAGKGLKGLAKRWYWHALVWSYSLAGRSIDIVMTNSSWTQAHMHNLWGKTRVKRQKPQVEVVFPPVAVEELIEAIPFDGPSASKREKILVYIAQFRPEKNHELILEAFACMVHSGAKATKDARLTLIGSVRDSDDDIFVYKLRLLARELKIEDTVEFRTKDVSWPEIVDWLRKSWVGVNGMWCEHFGIGVVEYQAAGLISVVNDSGGPKQDIVTDFDGGPTGFHASTVEEYAARFTDALSMSPSATKAMRQRARASSARFSTPKFASKWISQLSQLIDIARATSK